MEEIINENEAIQIIDDKQKLNLESINVDDESETEEESSNFQYHLFVHIKSGHDMPALKQNGSSDLYAKFLMNGKTVHRSKTVPKNLNPVWDESFMLSLPDLTKQIELKVMLTLKKL